MHIIDNLEATESLESLQMRKDIAYMAVLYHLYHSKCSEDLLQLGLPSFSLYRTTRA